MTSRLAALALALIVSATAQPQTQSEAPDPIMEAGKINARLAMEYLKRDQLQVAQEKIEKALAQNPKDVNVQLAAGLVYERLHEMQRAEKHFRQAVRADASSPEAQNALGAFLCRNNEHKKGEEMFLQGGPEPDLPHPLRCVHERRRLRAQRRQPRAGRAVPAARTDVTGGLP